MKFLKSWLQEYIVEQLPDDARIVDALNKKAFEVEEVITHSHDTVFDIKILPNRAHDSLGHHGMAYELCASLALTFNKEKEVREDLSYYDPSVEEVKVAIEQERLCTRFMAVRIDGVTVGESPSWLKERLEAIGQRSINTIVDCTNYVQFALNKPMHAYDARSIVGTLTARKARNSETLVTLSDNELVLDNETLVIADDEKVLGLAGIKGGKYSGIRDDTTSIIIESANFSPSDIRKTSEKYQIRSDASKRFENGIANNLVIEGLHMTANLIHSMYKGAKKGKVTDIYPKKDTPYYVGISKKELNDILGTSYDDTVIVRTLEQLSFSYESIVPEEYIKKLYPTLLGAAYKNPSSMREDAPHQFSCSSLISYLYLGVWMPSLSIDKYVYCKKIDEKELQFGDLIFSNSGEGLIRYESIEFLRGTKVPAGVDHVAMYLGDGTIIHATKKEGMVAKESLVDHAKGRTIIGYGRVLDDLTEKRYVVRSPAVRLDLRTKEDLAEELGRIIGYEKITPSLPALPKTGILHKRAFYENKIRSILKSHGFSEVMTYTFGDIGEVSLVKGLADDKEKLRTNLGKGILQSLSLNLYNAPLLGQKTIKIFEIGNVFSATEEHRHLGMAIDDGGKKSNFSEEMDLILSEIVRTLGIKTIEYDTVSSKPYVVECNIDSLIATLEEPNTYEASPFSMLPVVGYKPVSLYPFITRDIAVWVPSDVTWDYISSLCHQVGNPLIARIDLFDTFSKEVDGIKKTSYAFRLVFQSYEKTLTDDEVNVMMTPYYEILQGQGYEIR